METSVQVKSLFLICLSLPPPYSGEETLGENLRNGLESIKSKPYRVCYFDIGNKQSNAKRGRFNFGNVFVTLKLLFRFLNVLLRSRPDAIYLPLASNFFGFIKYGLFIYVASIFHCKIIVCFGGANFQHFFVRAPFLFQKWIQIVLRQITILIVQGERLRQQFNGLIHPDKIRIVPLGIDPTLFQKNSTNLFQRDKIHVLFVGCISKAKGAFDLLEAIPFIIQNNTNIHFHFVGEILKKEKNIVHIDNPIDNQEEFVRILKEKQIGQYVTWHGVLSGDNKVALYKQADIFTLPSYSESFPCVLLEAAATGLPMVITPVGSNPEIYQEGKNAFFVEVGNPKMMASRIVELIKDPNLRQKMGKNNQELVLGNYTHLHFGNRINTVLSRLI